MIIRQSILDTLGYEELTPMQKAMEKSVEDNPGVVLLSPTGSGKTLAFLLPLIQKINVDIKAAQAVVISPTRELAQQIEQVFRQMKTSISIISLYGGRPTMQEHRIIKEVIPQVIVATPGRLKDHLDKSNVNVDLVRCLVIDEFDKCLEMGFQDEMEDVLRYFSNIKSCWLTSATRAEEIPTFMQKVTSHFEVLDFLDESIQVKNRMKLYQVVSPSKDKLETLVKLLNNLSGVPTIVFVSHRESVERVGKCLSSNGFYSVMYHGGLDQDLREKALYRFRNGSANVLVSTDLAARGLDIPEVRAIVHYHMPLKNEEFTHRNGRTARWNAEGEIYVITSEGEVVPEYMENILPYEITDKPLKVIPPHFTTLYIGRGKSEKLSKGDILGFLCKKGGLNSNDIGRIDVSSHHSFVAVSRSKVANLLKLISNEKIKGMKTLIEETKKY